MEISRLLVFHTQVAVEKPAQPLSYTQSSHEERGKTTTADKNDNKILLVEEENPLNGRFFRLRHSHEAWPLLDNAEIRYASSKCLVRELYKLKKSFKTINIKSLDVFYTHKHDRTALASCQVRESALYLK